MWLIFRGREVDSRLWWMIWLDPNTPRPPRRPSRPRTRLMARRLVWLGVVFQYIPKPLAKELGVDHKAVVVALNQLEHEGLLLGQGAGRRRKIVLPAGRKAVAAMKIAPIQWLLTGCKPSLGRGG